MKSIFNKLFISCEIQSSLYDQEHALQVSTATLLIEVSRADFQEQESELRQMRQLLAEQFSLNDSELDDLMLLACEGADKMVSLQHITRMMNERFDQSMKARVIEMMWQVVYADGVKDHYEEHLIRQVSDLLYVSHSSFIQARHKAELSVNG